jgi:hypothetical protein
MTIQILPPDEWSQIEPLFLERGVPLPDPELARIIAAKDETDTISGFLVIQLVPHLEPFWIAPEHRGSPLWARLAETAAAQFPAGIPSYVFSPNAAITRMARHVGFRPQPWTVLMRI